MKLGKEAIKYNVSSEHLSSNSADSYTDEQFLPAGSLSSHEMNPEENIYSERLTNQEYENKAESPSNFIEYLEYHPTVDKKNDHLKYQSSSLCASPDLKENTGNKLSQTQVISKSKLFENENLKYQLLIKQEEQKIIDEGKYKTICENYERQNKILRDEVQECSKEISRLIKYQEKQKRNYGKINEENLKAKLFMKMIMESIGEILEENFEIPSEEHSYNFIASQLQLIQSRIARKQSLYIKTKNNLDQVLEENKEIKSQIADISQINSKLVEKLDKKKQKIKDMKKLIGKASERYTEEESDYRMSSSRVSKSSTPLSDEATQSKFRPKAVRALSAKEPMTGDIESYREALKDLKILSERAHNKISETRNKLKTIPKSSTGKVGHKFTGIIDSNLLKSPTFIKYYRN